MPDAKKENKNVMKITKPGYGKYDLDTGLSRDQKIQVRRQLKNDPAKKGNEFDRKLHDLKTSQEVPHALWQLSQDDA